MHEPSVSPHPKTFSSQMKSCTPLHMVPFLKKASGPERRTPGISALRGFWALFVAHWKPPNCGSQWLTASTSTCNPRWYCFWGVSGDYKLSTRILDRYVESSKLGPCSPSLKATVQEAKLLTGWRFWNCHLLGWIILGKWLLQFWMCFLHLWNKNNNSIYAMGCCRHWWTNV